MSIRRKSGDLPINACLWKPDIVAEHNAFGLLTALVARCSHAAALIVVLTLAAGGAGAGEISGLPPHLAPTVRPDYSFFLGNDFAAAKTSDDFRTEQMIATARLGESWVALLDHSIFTREDVPEPERGRIDTMTFSLGYEFLSSELAGHRTSMTAGLAVRGVGNFEGERIQNGFHRLIESDTSAIPYTDTRRTDPAGWFLAEHYRRLRPIGAGGLADRWDIGYWVRAGALATADGQLDAGWISFHAI